MDEVICDHAKKCKLEFCGGDHDKSHKHTLACNMICSEFKESPRCVPVMKKIFKAWAISDVIDGERCFGIDYVEDLSAMVYLTRESARDILREVKLEFGRPKARVERIKITVETE
jgi:hypothetical protein